MRIASRSFKKQHFSSKVCNAWAKEEFSRSCLSDQRLVKRLSTMAADFLQNVNTSIPRACSGQWPKIKGAYRFFDNERVTPQAVMGSHIQSTKYRMRQQQLVLAVQDSTSLNFSHHPATQGLGLVGSAGDRNIGLHLHTTMAFTAGGAALGIIHAKTWIRPFKSRGKAKLREKLPLRKKESQKWMESFEATVQLANSMPQTRVVSVGDREADLYELFLAASVHPNIGVLVRAQNNRPVHDEDDHCWERLAGAPLAGETTVQVPRKPGKKARTARLEVRFTEVTLKPPKRKRKAPPVKVWLVEAKEINSAEPEAIHWKLVTTVPVLSFADAAERLQWYEIRWLIEEYHRVLKSGCGVEKRQLEEAGRIEKVLMLDMIVAWKVLELTRAAREKPEAPAESQLNENEVEVLKQLLSRGKNEVLSMREAVRKIAMMGGFIGRKSDGEPGTMTIWRGLNRLQQMVEGYLIAQKCG